MANMTTGSIAIDGPAGAGKSTVSKSLAVMLGLTYIDTGAMYRAAALESRRLGLSLAEDQAIVDAVSALSLRFRTEPDPDEGLINHVYMDGEDVTLAIRDPVISELASPVSAIPGVRRILQARQRELALEGGVVMEGRDIGSVVLPGAEVKIFLTASVRERANRRFLELVEKGVSIDMAAVESGIRERDERDSTRDDSPLIKAKDAVEVDTDGKSIDQVVAEIAAIYRARLG